MCYVIEFAPPMSGFEGSFNTFRLGLKWSRVLKPGDKVLLVDKKQSMVFAVAQVEGVHTGKLSEMAQEHAARNHNQKGLDSLEAPSRLTVNMIKRYGPHKCSENSKVTVIDLRRTK